MPSRNKPSALPEPEQDVEQLRMEITRNLVRFVNRRQWPACPLRACRRLHACAAPDFTCANPVPPGDASPDETAAALAGLRRSLQRRLAELGELK
jgi:hypothetical protein